MTAIAERLAAALADRYRVDRELGAGGMAVVYLACDLRHDRQVALKVLRPEFGAQLGAERFLSEIRTTARLQHPHILPLYDSGVAEGLLYYVMPLVEGETLRHLMDRDHQLALDHAVRLTCEIADALAYAHQHGVIHRDVKPENILLSNGHALVADFGIARALTAAGARLTQTGFALGTPAYMSPEQAGGDHEVDGRSDEYSLACMLFEMLAGDLPFTGKSPGAILLRRFTQAPPRLSASRPGVPNAVDAAIHRAMAREPDERFPGVTEFAKALRAPTPSPGAPIDKSIAVLPFTNMSREPEDEFFSDGITEEIINVLSQLEGLRVAARTSSFSYKGTQEDLRKVAERLGVSTILEGSVRKAGTRLRVTAQLINAADGYHLWSERYDRELTDVFAIQDEIANAIAARLRITLDRDTEAQLVRPGTGHLEAYELFLKGRVLQTRRGRIRAGLECFEKAVVLDPNFADAQAWLADSYRLLAVFGLGPAAQMMPRAKAAAERAVELDPGLPEAHATLADVALLYDRDHARAEAAWDRALALSPSHVRARCERALWWFAVVQGDADRAATEVRLAREADPLGAWVAAMNGIVLGLGGRPVEALAEARRAVQLDPDGFVGRWLTVEAAMWAKDTEAAIQAAEPAFLMSGRHPWILASLALAHAGAGHDEVAAAIRAELEARGKTGFVQPFWLATAALATGDDEAAVTRVSQSVAVRDPVVFFVNRLPEWQRLRDHPGIVSARRELGLA